MEDQIYLLNFSQSISDQSSFDQLQEIMLQRNRYSNSWILHKYILVTENIFNIQANRYMEKIVIENNSRTSSKRSYIFAAFKI